jgi:hypothetical protein
MCIAGLGLTEPDTCFILALGRWIVEHKAIPTSDPFSWTYAIMPNGLPFVVHQWLTDVIFYVLVKNFGSISLIFLAALTTSIAFILVPLRILSLTAVSIRLAVPIVTILALASCAHMNIRPEIFSYSLLAVLMEILLRTDQFDKVNGATAISLVMLVIAWCNLHSSFVMGPLLAGIAILLVSNTGESSRNKTVAIFAPYVFHPFEPDHK